MMDNLAKTNCFTNHLRKLTDVVQARQDNPKPTHTRKHLMTHRGLQILPFVCNQMYVNSTMRAFLKEHVSSCLWSKRGGGKAGKKSPKRLRLWNPVPAIINPSWVAKLDHCLKPTAAGSGNQGSGQGSGTQGTKVPGPKGPGQRSNRWQGGGQRDNKSARLGSANPGFQYTLWVVPRFRKRGFQEDKVPGTQGSRNTRDSGNPPANLGCFVAGSAHADSLFVCSVGAQRRSTDLFWCCCKIFCLNCSDVASTKAHATSSN